MAETTQSTVPSTSSTVQLVVVATLLVVGAVAVVASGAAAGAGSSASLDVGGPTAASDNVTVTYAVTNTNESPANLSIIAPQLDDWDVVEKESADGTWTNYHVNFTNVANGDTAEATVTYEADDPTESVYLFNATVIDRDTLKHQGPKPLDNATHPVIVPENAVWKGTPLSLRADTSGAATVVDNQKVWLDNADGEQRSARRSELAVYDDGTTVPIELSSVDPGANLDPYGNDQVHVLVGHVAEQPDASSSANVSNDTIPRSISDAQSLLTAENLSKVNANVEFSRPSGVDSTLDSNGELSFDLNASEPGQYGLVVVRGERLFDVNDAGNVTAAGPSNGTVIGTEGVLVQSGASDLDAPDSVAPGDNVQIGIDTGLSGNVSHSVVLYHEDTWTGSQSTINLTAPLSTNMTTDDVILEHEITELNGVVAAQANADILGMTFSQRRASGAVLVDDIVEAAADEAGVAEIETKSTGSTSLDGSAIAVADVGADETIQLPTFGNWTEGEYRYVHVASENDSTRAFETNTGTLTVESESDGGGGGYVPPGDGGDGEEGGLAFEDVELSSTEIQSGGDVEVTVTVRNTGSSGISQSLTLYAGDVALDSQTVTMVGGGSERVTFQGTIEEAGTYDLLLDGTTLGTVEVAGSQDPGEPSIGVSSASLGTSTITAGDSVTVTATVENTGDADGETTVALTVDGEAVDEQTVSVAAGESTDVEFTRTFDEAGTYDVAVAGTSAGELTVEAESSSSDDGLPIVPIVIVLIVAGIAAGVGYLYHIGELDDLLE